MGHRIEGERTFARGTPRIDVRTPHTVRAEFFPNVHVFRIIDPAGGEAGRIGGINALAAAFARCDRGVARVSNPMHAAKLDPAFCAHCATLRSHPWYQSHSNPKMKSMSGAICAAKFARGIERRLVGGQIACWHPGIRIVDPCWPAA